MEAFSAELSLSLEISAEYAVGRCDTFPASFSAGQARRSNFLLVRASLSVRTLRFSPVSALAAAAAAAVALALAREFSVK